MGLDENDYLLFKNIYKEMIRMNDLKNQELNQQMFLIELIEEILPIEDNRKRMLHEKNIKRRY